MPPRISLQQARRIALAAQGFGARKDTLPTSRARIVSMIDRLALLQIDSVNVLTRAHYLPLFSRMGNYDTAVLDNLSHRKPRQLLEYWAHEASLIQPRYFAAAKTWQRRGWSSTDLRTRADADGLARRIVDLLGDGKPRNARAISAALDITEERAKVNWGWNWSEVKLVLESLFERGIVASARRNAQFEREYTLIEKLGVGLDRFEGISGQHRDQIAAAEDPFGALTAFTHPDRGDEHAQAHLDQLIEASARAHGIGTVRRFADYFRVPLTHTELVVKRLRDRGVVEEVEVPGWKGPVYLHAEARRPRKVRARALLSPFDSLIFERTRLERLFNVHYRIEIYTPEAKRQYGYYVLPFLDGENIVARVDLKADRATSRLLVRSAWGEPGAQASNAVELHQELLDMAHWLGLDEVEIEQRGNFAGQLLAAARQA